MYRIPIMWFWRMKYLSTIPGLTLKKKIERRTFESGKQSISIQEYLSLHNIAT